MIIPYIKHDNVNGTNRAIIELGRWGTLTIEENDGCQAVADKISSVLARVPEILPFMRKEAPEHCLY